MSDVEMLPSTISCSTISSYNSTSPPSPSYQVLDLPLSDDDNNFMPSGKRHGMAADGHLPGFALPDSLQPSDALLKAHQSRPFQEQIDPSAPRVGIRRPNSMGQMPNHQRFPHSASMQKLMDELSYLGDMIQK